METVVGVLFIGGILAFLAFVGLMASGIPLFIAGGKFLSTGRVSLGRLFINCLKICAGIGVIAAVIALSNAGRI